MILDIVVIVIAAIFMIIGFKRGLIKSIYGVLSIAASWFLSYMAGRALAEFVYKNYILSPITENIKNTFESASVNSSTASEAVFKGIPDFFIGILDGFGVTQRGFRLTLENASHFSEQLVLNNVNKVIGTVVNSALSVIFIIVLFLVIYLLLKLVFKKLIIKISKLPIIKPVNALLGGLLGLVEGLLIVFLLITIYKMTSGFINNTFITKELIDSSLIFKWFYNWNFIDMISDFTGFV